MSPLFLFLFKLHLIVQLKSIQILFRQLRILLHEIHHVACDLRPYASLQRVDTLYSACLAVDLYACTGIDLDLPIRVLPTDVEDVEPVCVGEAYIGFLWKRAYGNARPEAELAGIMSTSCEKDKEQP